tara:strand:- start:25 stop:258 length:234 start_codon:yes stop_codon:yes gene_type:complete
MRVEIYEKRVFREYIVPIRHALIGLFVISILFEIIAPRINKLFTADYLDVFYYLAGAAIYYLLKIRVKSNVMVLPRI